MKLDPAISQKQIEELLTSQSTLVYGEERTAELAEQIGQLAMNMAELARRELDLRDAPPDTSGIVDWSGR